LHSTWHILPYLRFFSFSIIARRPGGFYPSTTIFFFASFSSTWNRFSSASSKIHLVHNKVVKLEPPFTATQLVALIKDILQNSIIESNRPVIASLLFINCYRGLMFHDLHRQRHQSIPCSGALVVYVLF